MLREPGWDADQEIHPARLLNESYYTDAGGIRTLVGPRPEMHKAQMETGKEVAHRKLLGAR